MKGKEMTNEERRQDARAEKQRQKNGKLKTKAIRYFWGDQIIRFEKKCFGWHYTGHTTDVEVSYDAYDAGDSVKVKQNKKFITYDYFERPRVWKKNALFMLTEMLSNFVSSVRRFTLPLSIILLIIGVIVGFIGESWTFTVVVLCVYAGIIALSFVLAGLGALWMKVFKLKKETDKVLTENGYAIWDDNEEGEFHD